MFQSKPKTVAENARQETRLNAKFIPIRQEFSNKFEISTQHLNLILTNNYPETNSLDEHVNYPRNLPKCTKNTVLLCQKSNRQITSNSGILKP